MLSELWRNLQNMLRPYSLEDFIRDYDPKDHYELEQAERLWSRYRDEKFWQ